MKKGLSILTIAAALSVFGCEFLLGPDLPVGGGNLVISLVEGTGPALLSSAVLESLRYDLVLTGPEGRRRIEDSVSAGGSYTRQVDLGEWHIYAEAYDPANVLIGTGTAPRAPKPSR